MLTILYCSVGLKQQPPGENHINYGKLSLSKKINQLEGKNPVALVDGICAPIKSLGTSCLSCPGEGDNASY